MKIQKNQFLSTEGGLFEVLRIALPLIMGAAAHALNLLADRVMLSHYSEEAVAASLTGGLTGFTIACFFPDMEHKLPLISSASPLSIVCFTA